MSFRHGPDAVKDVTAIAQISGSGIDCVLLPAGLAG